MSTMQLKDRIGCRLKLQDIHVLMTVVETGSMGKAAAVLNTGQPAISRSVAELERALGVQLLERNSQGVRATEYGRAFLSGGAAVFDDLRQSVRNVASLADPAVGEVRIGCNPTLAASFVAVVIDQVSRRYPRATFRVVTAYPDRMPGELADRNVDLLIARRFGPITDKQFLDYEQLFDDPFVVVAGQRNTWAAKKRIKLADLVDEPWALSASNTIPGALVLEAFRACKLPPPVPAVIVESGARLNLVAQGRLLSVFPESVLRFSGKHFDLKALPVKPALSSVPVGIVTVKGRILSPLPKLFIESARKLANGIASRR
jgi:DNA-binding transcriptional LysR family regulator